MLRLKKFHYWVNAGVAAALLGASASTISGAYGAVWESRNSWTPEVEAKYSEWVRTQWNADVFTNPNSFLYNLQTDCADAAYTMRATYAYQNQLPFALRDPSGGAKPISNEMTRWDRQALSDKDKFFEFLKYIHNLGSSTTISEDTYPVEINRKWVRAGDVLLRYTHHVYEIKDVRNTGLLHLIASTVPRAVRKLNENLHFNSSVSPLDGNGGIRAFREPKDLFTPAWKITGYSNEQFKFPHEEYPELVKTRLSLVKETPDEQLRNHYDRVCRKAKERVDSVNEAVAYQEKTGRCMNASEFDDYSTTSRDQDLRTEFDSLKSFVASNNAIRNQFRNVALWNEAVKVVMDQRPDTTAQMTKSFQFCAVNYKSGFALSLKEIRRRFELGLISDDPNLKLEARWGDEKAASTCRRY
jgi:hypothetical protein